MFRAFSTCTLMLVATGCGSKKHDKPRATVNEFLKAMDATNADELKAVMASKPDAFNYFSHQLKIELDHPWFGAVSCEVDEKTGVLTGGSCMFTPWKGLVAKHGVESVAAMFSTASDALRPTNKRVVDALNNTFKIDLGEVGTFDPTFGDGVLFVCSISRGPGCKAVERALLTASLPPP